jgi:hypothetical protein
MVWARVGLFKLGLEYKQPLPPEWDLTDESEVIYSDYHGIQT